MAKITKKDVPVGSVWDVPPTNRVVVVLAHCKVTGKVIIESSSGRTTKAKLERFNGLMGGYKRSNVK